MLIKTSFKQTTNNNKELKLSKNQGFSDISAQRYSLALYELSTEANSLDAVEKHVYLIMKLIKENEDFNNLIKDPTVKQEYLTSVINKISENFKIENLLNNFMFFLIQKRRLFYLEKILNFFLEICSSKRGEIKAEIQSAKKLNQDEIKEITDDLTKNFGSKIKLKYKYDENLIGGLIIKIGSVMIDTSIKNKLQQIENKMIEA